LVEIVLLRTTVAVTYCKNSCATTSLPHQFSRTTPGYKPVFAPSIRPYQRFSIIVVLHQSAVRTSCSTTAPSLRRSQRLQRDVPARSANNLLQVRCSKASTPRVGSGTCIFTLRCRRGDPTTVRQRTNNVSTICKHSYIHALGLQNITRCRNNPYACTLIPTAALYEQTICQKCKTQAV
jgi:hypothetical protein